MRIPACPGALGRSRRLRHITQVHTQAGSTATHDPQPIRSFISLHHVVRPHTTSHLPLLAASASASPRQVCEFLRSFITRALRLAQSSRVSNVQNGTPTGYFLCCSRDCYATRWRNITARARVDAEKWLSNGAYARL